MQPIEKVFEYVDGHFDEMLRELKSLCASPSVAGCSEGLDEAREKIASKLKSLGIEPVFHNVSGGNALISAEVKGSGPESILFYNHYDVVEPGDAEKWDSKAPFEVCLKDGKLWGRGVSDDKGPLCSRVHALQALLAVNGELPLTVSFLYEGDEESSSASMKCFARKKPDQFRRLIDRDLCVWEGGAVDSQDRPYLRFGVRGSVAFDLCVTTACKDVHSRMGATIESASWRMVKALYTLRDRQNRIALKGFYDSVVPLTQAERELLHVFPYDETKQKKSLGISYFLNEATGEKLKEQIYSEPSMSICALTSGEPHKGVRGIVPHTAYARVNFYLVANQRPEEVARQLREHFDSQGFSDIEVIRLEGGSAAIRTPVDIPFHARACRVASKVFSGPLVAELTQLGAGPASVLRDALPSLPIVGFGPANMEPNHHAPNENLTVENYRKAIKFVIALVYSYYDSPEKEV